jgi:hypothetical protein
MMPRMYSGIISNKRGVTISEEELITNANVGFSTGRTVPGRG